MTKVENDTDFELTLDTPYLALTGEIWCVYRDYVEENWPRDNGTALYINSVYQNSYSLYW